MSHPRPLQWADLAAGKLAPSQAEALVAHAAACAPCARAQARVGAARAALVELAAAAPLSSEASNTIEPRIYWQVSSELRRRERERDERVSWVRRLLPAVLTAAIGGVGLWLFTIARRVPEPNDAAVAVAPVVAVVPASAPIPVVLDEPTPLVGVVTFLQGDVTLDGKPLVPDAEIRAGARLVTKQGRVAVQFGERTGFQLDADASAEVAAFDSRNVELRLASGAIGVEVEKRHADQHFVVVADGRTVDVRGTVFRVADRAGRLDVSVTRGRVAVQDPNAEVDVPAGTWLAVAPAAPLAKAAPRPLAPGDPSVHVPTLPSFGDAAALRAGSALLAVAAPARAHVKVDGVDCGDGAFVMRVEPGRMLVSTGDASRWVDAEAGAPASANLTPVAGTSERPGQLDAQLRAHHAAIEQCGAAARKLDPSAAGVLDVEVGIAADGSVEFVAPVRSDLDPQVEGCLLGVIRDWFTFPAGTRATVQKKLRY